MTNYEELINDLIDAVREDTAASDWGTYRYGWDAQRQALLDALPEWQPMDTAPKDDETWIIGKTTINGEAFVVVMSWGIINTWENEANQRHGWRVLWSLDSLTGEWGVVDTPDAWMPVADLLALPMR